MGLNLHLKSFFILFIVLVSVMFAEVSMGQTIASILESRDAGMGGRAVVTATVFAPDGQRLRKRIRVKLVTETKGDRILWTNDEGIFVIRGLPNGAHSILIEKEDSFEPLTLPIQIINNQDLHLSIRLTVRQSTDAKPEVVNAELAGLPKEAVQAFEKAAEFARKNDLASAIDHLKIAIDARPDFFLAHSEIGGLYLRSGQLQNAEISLRAALALKPDAEGPRVNLGIVFFQMKRYEEAEQLWRSIVNSGKNLAVGHYFLGQTLTSLRRFDEALTELEAAIEMGGARMKDAHKTLAFIYGQKGDKERAAKELEIYLKLAPDAPDAKQLREVLSRLKSKEPPR